MSPWPVPLVKTSPSRGVAELPVPLVKTSPSRGGAELPGALVAVIHVLPDHVHSSVHSANKPHTSISSHSDSG